MPDGPFANMIVVRTVSDPCAEATRDAASSVRVRSVVCRSMPEDVGRMSETPLGFSCALAEMLCYATVVPGSRSTYEDHHDRGGVAVSGRLAAHGAGCPAPGNGEPAVHHGVLLQGPVGPAAGVPPALPEEPLSAAAEGSGDGPARLGQDRD